MKSFCLVTLGLAALLPNARADLTLVQKVEGMSHGGREMTIWVKGDKARFDISPQMSMIVDGKTGELINLMKDQKKFMRLSVQQMKAIGEMAAKFTGTENQNEKPKLAPTGKKEMVNGYEAAEYTYAPSGGGKSGISPLFKGSYWIATNYPNGSAILKQLQAIRSDVWTSAAKGLPGYQDFPGLPVKSQISVGNQEIVTTLVSAKEDPVSEDLFVIPKDYQEMKMPGMFGEKSPGKPE